MANLMLAKNHSTALEEAHNQRLEKARFMSSQGIALMSLAELNQYQNRELVLQACHYLMDAIQIKRDFIEAYLHLARAFIVFHDDRQAVKYLLQAKAYAPEHPDILQLLAFLQESTPRSKDTRPQKKLESAFEQSLDTQDLEALEHQLLADIRALIASEHAQIELSLDPQSQAQMKKAHHSLKEQYETIQARLKLLAQESEILSLELALRPLEILLRRFESYIAASAQLSEIHIQLQGLTVEVQKHLDEFKTNPQLDLHESALDKTLDCCDAVADKMEALASQNQDIALVEKSYQNLIDLIMHWQDLLDS